MVYNIASVLSDWQTLGVFDYVLPFLLIFAFVYGILAASGVFSRSKGVNLIISLAIGLLSLRFEFVPLFFSEIFPRFGVGIAVFLVFIILAALFIPDKFMRGWSLTFASVGILIAIIVIYNSFDRLGWGNLGGGSFWDQWGSMIILAVVLIAVIAAIVMPKINIATDHAPAVFGGWKREDK